MRLAAVVGIIVVCLVQATQAIQQKDSDRNSTSITGRVVNDSGKPMPGARVSVFGVGRQTVRRMVITDDTGRYVADGLPRGSYGVSAQANGYVFTPDPGEPAQHRTGETVNLTLRKGAVITGRVTNSFGQPVVAVPINATLVRNNRGVASSGFPGTVVYTDDRGVYRLFGLHAGTYVVAAGMRTSGTLLTTAYADDSPTYYPSSTRDTASEVTVEFGVEASGIDIRYRGDAGYAISGTIIGASVGDLSGAPIIVLLYRSSTGAVEGQSYVQQRGGDLSFAAYGVPDGDYYLTARRGADQSDDGAVSKRIPVKVRGGDVTGIAISLIPNGSIAGRLTLDVSTLNLKCERVRPPAVEETLLSIQSDEAESASEPSRGRSSGAVADSNGDFLFRGLMPGRYRFESRGFLDESWYVRALTMPGPTNSHVGISLSGITVRSGQRINGIRVVLGEGAASLRGRVIGESKEARLPERLRVHLVPAEPDSLNEILRFYEAEVQADGSFSLTNLSPGRYLLVTRQRTEDEIKERRPLSWNAATRAALHRLAAAGNTTLTLKPCQRVVEYELRYTSAKEAPPTKKP